VNPKTPQKEVTDRNTENRRVLRSCCGKLGRGKDSGQIKGKVAKRKHKKAERLGNQVQKRKGCLPRIGFLDRGTRVGGGKEEKKERRARGTLKKGERKSRIIDMENTKFVRVPHTKRKQVMRQQTTPLTWNGKQNCSRIKRTEWASADRVSRNQLQGLNGQTRGPSTGRSQSKKTRSGNGGKSFSRPLKEGRQQRGWGTSGRKINENSVTTQKSNRLTPNPSNALPRVQQRLGRLEKNEAKGTRRENK